MNKRTFSETRVLSINLGRAPAAPGYIAGRPGSRGTNPDSARSLLIERPSKIERSNCSELPALYRRPPPHSSSATHPARPYRSLYQWSNRVTPTNNRDNFFTGFFFILFFFLLLYLSFSRSVWNGTYPINNNGLAIRDGVCDIHVCADHQSCETHYRDRDNSCVINYRRSAYE